MALKSNKSFSNTVHHDVFVRYGLILEMKDALIRQLKYRPCSSVFCFVRVCSLDFMFCMFLLFPFYVLQLIQFPRCLILTIFNCKSIFKWLNISIPDLFYTEFNGDFNLANDFLKILFLNRGICIITFNSGLEINHHYLFKNQNELPQTKTKTCVIVLYLYGVERSLVKVFLWFGLFSHN